MNEPSPNATADGTRSPESIVLLALVVVTAFSFMGSIALGSMALTSNWETMYKDLGQNLPGLTILFMKITPAVPLILPVAYLVSVAWCWTTGARMRIIPATLIFLTLCGTYIVGGVIALFLPMQKMIQNL